MLGKMEGGRRGQQRIRWLEGITDSMDMSLSKLSRSWGCTGSPGMLQSMGKQSDTTEQLSLTEGKDTERGPNMSASSSLWALEEASAGGRPVASTTVAEWGWREGGEWCEGDLQLSFPRNVSSEEEAGGGTSVGSSLLGVGSPQSPAPSPDA